MLTEHPHIWRHDPGESRLAVYELWIRRLHMIEWMVESPTQHPVLGPERRECERPRGSHEELGATSADADEVDGDKR